MRFFEPRCWHPNRAPNSSCCTSSTSRRWKPCGHGFAHSVDVADRLMVDVRRSLADNAAGISAETGITAQVNVTAGDVLNEIQSSCGRADMLVLGARGNNSLRDAFIGTTAERLLGKCQQPILIVKRPPKQPYARVLVPLDFTPNSEKTLRMAAQSRRRR